MRIVLKDGTEADIPEPWIHEWASLYWMDDISVELEKARLWCLDNPQKRKTRRGLRAFLGNWVRRSCRLKPQVRMINPPIEDHPHVPREVSNSAIAKMKELLK